jgi:hypothetical protein
VEQSSGGTNVNERRQSARYELQGVAQFRWRASDGNWHDGVGTTSNIGRGGAFIATQSAPPIASYLHVEVTIPVSWAVEAEVRLSGFGDVRHVTTGEVEPGFGAFVLFRTDSVSGAA